MVAAHHIRPGNKSDIFYTVPGAVGCCQT